VNIAQNGNKRYRELVMVKNSMAKQAHWKMIGGLSNKVQQLFSKGLIRCFPVETFTRAVIE
jgi:hypothetical protein